LKTFFTHSEGGLLARTLARLIAIIGAAIVLLSLSVAHASSSGPASGGNTLIINGTGLGNGSDITNVTICGVAATIQNQTASSVTVVAGVGGVGTGDILVYSSSVGVTTFANAYTYNPPGFIFGTPGWSTISNLPAARQSLGAVSASGKIYAIGGGGQSTVYVYDTAQPTLGWLSISNLPVGRSDLASAVVDGKIYAIGGNFQSTVYVYDPSQPTQGWLSLSNFPSAIQDNPAVSVNGKIYVFGSYVYVGNNTWSYQPTVYAYDPSQPAQGWLSVSNLQGIFVQVAASVNGKIYVVDDADDFHVYDPSQAAMGWLSLSNSPTPTGYFGDPVAVGSNGKIYVLDGWSTGVWVYDPTQPTVGWLSASNLPAAHPYLAAVSVNDNIYAIGGSSSSNVYQGSITPGVAPNSGLWIGSNTVVISGNNLGNGDVTNVTLCGVPATILVDNSPTEVVVRAGAAAAPTIGDVVVYSTSYGVTVKSNAYSYYQSFPTITTSNSLPPAIVGIAYNQTFTESGGVMPFTWAITSGSLPPGLSLSANGVISGIPAVATNASFTVQVTGNDGLSTSKLIALMIAVESASNGPAFGGNTLTITGTGLGNGSDITNVTVCGVTAVIVSQTADSVTVVLGTASDGSTGDVKIFSASLGMTIFVNGYTYNPPLGGVIFGPFTGWSSISKLPFGYANFPATSVNGKIYVVGGSESGGELTSVFVYDPAKPTLGWSSVSSLPARRGMLAAAAVNGKIYALGGYDNYVPPVFYYSTVFVYDTTQPALGWLSVSNLPVALSRFSAVSANGKIYAIGGNTNNYVYDPAQPTLGWSSFSSLPVGASPNSAVNVNGKIYQLYGSSVFVYDPFQPALGWLPLVNLPSPAASAVSLNGKLYALGAHTTNYVYDPSQPTLGWLNASNLPTVRSYLAGATANGRIYAIETDDVHGPPPAPTTTYEGTFASGVAPTFGPLAGGNTVTITGNNLGNGDVTNVTLCGIPATILADYSPTQIVVTAGTAPFATNGDVVVNSTSYGTTIKSSGYSYLQLPTIMTAFDGTNLQLSWPTNFLGWKLEARTNGLGNNWFPVAGSTATNQFPILINPANSSVFYRLHQQ
jgi:N-acetylneuraminic acid mutarotase